MKFLTPEEANNITPLRAGRETLLSANLKRLKLGEGLIMEAKEWKTKDTPYRVANNVAKKWGRKFEQGRMPDGSGWFFKRVL